MTTIAGKYELDRAEVESVDDYLKNLGVGLVLRKVLTTARPKLEIVFAPDTEQWSITTETPFKTSVVRFKMGQRIEDETLDARKCFTVGEVKEDKIVLQQQCEEGPDVTVVKEVLENDMLRVTWTANNISATQIYRKVV